MLKIIKHIISALLCIVLVIYTGAVYFVYDAVSSGFGGLAIGSSSQFSFDICLEYILYATISSPLIYIPILLFISLGSKIKIDKFKHRFLLGAQCLFLFVLLLMFCASILRNDPRSSTTRVAILSYIVLFSLFSWLFWLATSFLFYLNNEMKNRNSEGGRIG